MSSTNRSKARDGHAHDYYVTPINPIEDFLSELLNYEPNILNGNILDPCAGGDNKNPMSYPSALSRFNVSPSKITTIDIREDSRAEIKENYLHCDLSQSPDLIITNPPFNVVLDFIKKSLQDVNDGGFVVMLLRLNFFGGKSRKYFWEKHMPKYVFVHHKRMSFTADKKTDSIEYAHFVWQKGFNPEFSLIKVI